MKLVRGLFLLSLIFLLGCARDITKGEAENITKDYVISKIGQNPNEPLIISNIFLKENEWYVQISVGDDKGTLVLDKKGKIIKFEDRWI